MRRLMWQATVVVLAHGINLIRIVKPPRPVAASHSTGRAVVDGHVARRAAPSWDTHGAARQRREVRLNEPDDDTLVLLACTGLSRGDQQEWMRTLDDILEPELALDAMLDDAALREDREVEWLDDLWPDHPTWPRGGTS